MFSAQVTTTPAPFSESLQHGRLQDLMEHEDWERYLLYGVGGLLMVGLLSGFLVGARPVE